MYDFLIVGAGLYGSVVAHELVKVGKKVLVVDRRNHIGGNCYTENIDGISLQHYGAHIFRTSRKDVWDYIRSFAEFNHYVNSPMACYKGKFYNMPFNMNTFNEIWGTVTPAQAKAKIEEQRKEVRGEPQNLEEKAISLVGRDIYEILVKEYTEKQWGRPCHELPANIIRRLPVRFIYDNNYYNDPYQGFPIGGYTPIFEKMLKGSEVHLGVDFLKNREAVSAGAKKIIYTGAIDEYYDFRFGPLEYRSLRFEHEHLHDTDNYQGNAVVNFTGHEHPYTRIIEHKHFEFGKQASTIISREYSHEWKVGEEPYYPLNDAKNQELYGKYAKLAKMDSKVIFGGRLGLYQYTDMQDTIILALEAVKGLV